ncbi:MAG: hypothetical protein R3284_09250, partial [Rubricoccaceae bacterium]|nr:hypothetical protein [Rubricoccaceae bacterium]
LAIDSLFEEAIALYKERGLLEDVDRDALLELLGEFMRRRVETFLKEKGIPYDVVAAVSAVTWARPAVALARASAMQALRGDAAFERLITGVRRVGNILANEMKHIALPWDVIEGVFIGEAALTDGIRFDSASFEDDAERELLAQTRRVIPKLKAADAKQDVAAALKLLSGLGPAIDLYFDKVLVNVPDDTLRRNRHAFLAAIYSVFSRYADFSHIVEEGKTAVV